MDFTTIHPTSLSSFEHSFQYIDWILDVEKKLNSFGVNIVDVSNIEDIVTKVVEALISLGIDGTFNGALGNAWKSIDEEF